MNFDDPSQIVTEVTNLLLAQQKLMINRTMIQRVFNGEAPMTPEQMQEENVFTNVNFLSGTKIASNAVNQVNATFFGPERFFSVRCNVGPQRLRSTYSAIVSTEIAKLMKKSRTYKEARKSANAQVVLHGPGPIGWRNRKTPLPSSLGIEDVLVPMGTTCDMENLDRFALYRELTWPQLHKMAFEAPVDKGWNKPYVRALCDTLYHQGYQPIYQGNRWLFPEKLAEDYKEGAAYTFSSALPKVLAWDFFYRNDETEKWNRKLVLDYNNMAPLSNASGRDINWEKTDVYNNRETLYEMDDYAEDWQQIIHWYVGNCSNVAPYRYHSIRSIGYLLFALVVLDNKMRNRQSDYYFTQMLTWLRNVSDDNREKLGLVDLQNFGVMPDGVSIVPAGERYACDPNLILMALNQNRQLMAESSSSFIPELPGAPGNGKEMSATEAVIRQNTSMTLTSAVTGQLSDQSYYEYCEIARRFCIKDNPDPMAKALRKALREQGVPEEVLDYERWDVVPEMSKGAGNKAQQVMVTQALFERVYPLLDGNGQRHVLRDYITALTDNPTEAMLLVPEAPEQVNSDMLIAQNAFAVLMEGAPFQAPEGTDHAVMAQVLMQLTGGTLNQVQAAAEQPGGLPIAVQKLTGAANVLQHVQGSIAKLAESGSVLPQRKAVVKQMAKQFELLQGELQQLAKQVMAAQEEQQPQMNGEQAKLQAKLQDMQATGEMNRQLAAAAAAQKMEQQQLKWDQENNRRNADTAAEIERGNARTLTELRNSAVKAQGEVQIATLKEAKKPAPKAGVGK